MIGVAFEVVMATIDHPLAPPLHLASEVYPPSVLRGVTPKTTSFNRCCPNAVFKTKSTQTFVFADDALDYLCENLSVHFGFLRCAIAGVPAAT